MKQKTLKTNSIFKSSIWLFALQIVTLVLAFLRSSIFAKLFGASAEADAFTLALEIPTVLFAAVTAAIKTVVIPLYSKLTYSESKEKADKFFSNILTITALVSLALMALIILLSKTVVTVFAPGLSPETNALAAYLLRLTTPTLVLVAIIDVCSAVLEARKVFVMPRLFNDLAMLVRIGTLVLFAGVYGIVSCAIGYLAGTFISTVLVTAETLRVTKYTAEVDFKDKNLISALRRSVPVFLSTGTAELNRMADKILASLLPEGSIAALGYASTLSRSATSLFVNCIATVVYPTFAEKAAKDDKKGLAEVYIKSLSIFLHVTVPVFAGALILRDELVRLVFMRGAFDEAAAILTSSIFIFYFAGVMFSGLRQTSARLFFSLGDTKTPMKNTIIGLVLNIVLNVALGNKYVMGASGLALATSLSTAVICFMLMRSAKKIDSEIRYRYLCLSALKVILGSSVMAGVVLLMKIYLPLTGVVQLLALTAAGAVVYLIMMVLLRSQELRYFVGMLKRQKKGPQTPIDTEIPAIEEKKADESEDEE